MMDLCFQLARVRGKQAHHKPFTICRLAHRRSLIPRSGKLRRCRDGREALPPLVPRRSPQSPVNVIDIYRKPLTMDHSLRSNCFSILRARREGECIVSRLRCTVHAVGGLIATGSHRTDVFQMGEKTLGICVAFPTKNFIAVDRELIEKIFLFLRRLPWHARSPLPFAKAAPRTPGTRP